MTDLQRKILLNYAREHAIPMTEQAPLKEHTSFRIGGPAALLSEPEKAEDLAGLCALAQEQGVNWVLLGNGSNVLAADEGYDGLVIKSTGLSSFSFDGAVLKAEAGVSLYRLATEAGARALTGLEFAQGIPGSLGGAVFMNAGAYGGEMSQVLQSADFLDTETGEIRTLGQGQLELGYRTSVFARHPRWIVLRAVMKLQPGDSAQISAKMAELAQSRRAKQPLDKPSAGSTFKRPEGNFAGKLIEECGLKGAVLGQAQVSPKHAGFIVNNGGATAAQVRQLIAHVQEVVLEQTGVRLEPEVRFLG